MKFISYGRQSIDYSDQQAVQKILKSGWLTQGPAVAKFEKDLARYCQVKFAVALSNGTAALHTAYFAAGLKPGDEFITSSLTFLATANAGLYLGAKPVFADIDEFGGLDPKEVEKKITKKTKLICAVDFAGVPCDLQALKKIAKKHKIMLVEDAAHSLGSQYLGKSIASQSDLTTLSFHPVKSITTGEGGAVLTNNKILYEKLLLFRSHGLVKNAKKCVGKVTGGWYQEMQLLGYNYRLTDIQSALGSSQLKRLDSFILKRREIAERYHRWLQDLPLILPSERPKTFSSWHLYVVKLPQNLWRFKNNIFEDLRKLGIGVQVHYVPVHMDNFYKQLGYDKLRLTKTKEWYEAEFSLPIYPDLSENDQKRVVKSLKKVLKKYAQN